MLNLEVGSLYIIKDKIGWQVKCPLGNSDKYQLLFPSMAINSNVGDVVLVLEKVCDDDHNKIILFGEDAHTYKILTKDNQIVYMYTFTKNNVLEKII